MIERLSLIPLGILDSKTRWHKSKSQTIPEAGLLNEDCGWCWKWNLGRAWYSFPTLCCHPSTTATASVSSCCLSTLFNITDTSIIPRFEQRSGGDIEPYLVLFNLTPAIVVRRWSLSAYGITYCTCFHFLLYVTLHFTFYIMANYECDPSLPFNYCSRKTAGVPRYPIFEWETNAL